MLDCIITFETLCDRFILKILCFVQGFMIRFGMVDFDYVDKNLKVMFQDVDVSQSEYLIVENEQFKLALKCRIIYQNGKLCIHLTNGNFTQ